MEHIVDQKDFEDSFKTLIDIYHHFLNIQSIVSIEESIYSCPAFKSTDDIRFNLIILYLNKKFNFNVEELMPGNILDEIFDYVNDYFCDVIYENRPFSLQELDINIDEALKEAKKKEEEANND